MLCPCTSNILRSFVRSVSQVDPLSSTRVGLKPLQKYPYESVGRQAFRDQYGFSRRAYSSTAAAPDFQPSEIRSYYEAAPADTKSSEGADVELSRDAISAITAESNLQHAIQHDRVSQQPVMAQSHLEDIDDPSKFISSISQSVEKPVKRSKKQHEHDVRRPILRRTKVENTGFKLHLSSPRQPRIEGLAAKRQPKNPPKRVDWTPPEREHWMKDKEALREKYPDGWDPKKRLSPDAIAGIRALHSQMPEKYHTAALAEKFEVSPEMIRRILKSKWRPTTEEETDRRERWVRRGQAVWGRWADLGNKPPMRWREMGIKNNDPRRRQRQKPALLTYPRREGGLFAIRDFGDDEPGNIEDKIL